MLISPLTFREFDDSTPLGKAIRKKPFAQKKEEEPEAPPPPPSFSEEQLKAAERDAYQKGFLEGTKEGHSQAQSEHAEIDRQITEGLENFIKSINPVFAQYKAHCQQLKQNMPVLALSIAKKVAGEALSIDHIAIIEAASKQCAEIMVSEPEITVTVNSRLAPALSHKIKQLGNREKAALVTVIPDEAIALSNYRIEWKNGSIERNIEKLWQQMDKAIGNMLATIANEEEEQLDLLNIKHTQKE